MKPAAAANQLTHVWRQICPEDAPYPVNCRRLAEALGIKVVSMPIDDQFEAQLRIRKKNGKRIRAIIYNEKIREEGRKNFCISHEIGHSSCHTDRDEFFCSSADLNDMAPHPENIEQEANLFAATLLMPADDFREQLTGLPISLFTLGQLADTRYNTSLTATTQRLLELSPTKYYGMAVVERNVVKRWARSDSMKWTGFGFRRGHQLAIDDVGHSPQGQEVDSDIWLAPKNAAQWSLTQSSVAMPYYGQTLVLLVAERKDWPHDHDDQDQIPVRIPSFR